MGRRTASHVKKIEETNQKNFHLIFIHLQQWPEFRLWQHYVIALNLYHLLMQLCNNKKTDHIHINQGWSTILCCKVQFMFLESE